MRDKQVAILQPQKPITYYQYDLSSQKLTPAKENKGLGEEALAYALFGSVAYKQGLYHL